MFIIINYKKLTQYFLKILMIFFPVFVKNIMLVNKVENC